MLFKLVEDYKPRNALYLSEWLDRFNQFFDEKKALYYDRKFLSIDTETTGLCTYIDEIKLLQLGYSNETVLIFTEKALHIPEIFEFISNLFIDKSVVKLFHNAKFDIQFLKKQGFNIVFPLADTMLTEQILSAGRGYSFSLKALAKKYLNRTLDKSLQAASWDNLTYDKLVYAANDVLCLLDIHIQQVASILRLGLSIVYQLEHQAIIPIAEMQLKGINFNYRLFSELYDKSQKRNRDAELKWQDLAYTQDWVFNYNSVHEAIAFFEHLLKVKLESLDKHNTTSLLGALEVDTIEYDMLKAYIDYRESKSIIEKFFYPYAAKHIKTVNGAPTQDLDADYRIYPQWNQLYDGQYGTVTGRFSCSNPNLQQIVKSFDPNSIESSIRKCFIPDKGKMFVIADYKQIELVVCAVVVFYAGYGEMLKLLLSGIDIHLYTAAALHDMTIDQFNDSFPKNKVKLFRKLAKFVNFGLIYAGSYKVIQNLAAGYGLDEETSMLLTDEKCQGYYDKFHKSIFPGVSYWHESLKRSLFNFKRTNQIPYIQTITNRRRYFPQNVAVTQLANTSVQSVATGDIPKRCLVLYDFHPLRDYFRPVFNIHDEFVWEVDMHHPQLNTDEAAQSIIRELMIQASADILSDVKIDVDIKTQAHWG